jgi:hypothetical protein
MLFLAGQTDRPEMKACLTTDDEGRTERRVGGQGCAGTLTACAAGICVWRGCGHAKNSAAPTLRWAAEFSQRENCHQRWWPELRRDPACLRSGHMCVWRDFRRAEDSAAPALPWAPDWPQRGHCHHLLAAGPLLPVLGARELPPSSTIPVIQGTMKITERTQTNPRWARDSARFNTYLQCHIKAE